MGFIFFCHFELYRSFTSTFTLLYYHIFSICRKNFCPSEIASKSSFICFGFDWLFDSIDEYGNSNFILTLSLIISFCKTIFYYYDTLLIFFIHFSFPIIFSFILSFQVLFIFTFIFDGCHFQ